MERSTIHLLAKRGKSQRQIARELGRSRVTVARALREPVDQGPTPRCRASKTDPYRAQVEAWARAGLTGVRMLELARACRLQIPVCLLTNATTRLRADLDRLGLSGEFDFVVNSAEVGAMKPHAAIFQAALRLAGVPPPDTLYVDDTREHVAAAQQLGIRGHLFRGVEDLTQELAQCGVLTRAPSTQE